MKLALLIATAIAGLAMAASASTAPAPALLTIPKLGIYSKPIGNGSRMLAVGTVWQPGFNSRPGQGRAMVIAGHDVTRVPGYGDHGPFYNLVTLRKGDLVEIRWHGWLFKYRFLGKPAWHRESDDQVVVDRGVEAVWFYSCWPRHTHNGRKWAEAELVSAKKL